MKRILRKLLEEQGDDVSMIRLMSLVSMLTGVFIGLYGVYRGTDLSGVAAICAVFIGSAFAGKTVSKFAEKQEDEE